MMTCGPGWMGGGWLLMLIWSLIGLVVLVGLVALLVWGIVQVVNVTSGRGGRGDSAQRVLNERYARGEISREEYERVRSDLLRRSQPG